MGILKNGKHELFAQKWHELDNKTEAYRQSHPSSLKWKDAAINVKACELSKNDKVLVRYNELKQAVADNHGITVKSLLKELEAIKTLAMGTDTPQCSAAAGCVMSKAKLVGLDIVKIELVANETLTPWDTMVIAVATRNDSDD